jgi:predicted TIM-barrel fold metal-dependent hydrolase
MTAPASVQRPVSAPARPLPAGAWDCHAHVFGPFDTYPILEPRRYDPPLAPAADYLAMLDRVGFDRGVLVHSSASGYDNSVTFDAVGHAAGRVTGVAVVSPDTTDAELERLHAQGFRGLRFTITGARSQQFTGSLDYNDLRAFAPRLRALGWHAQIWSRCDYVMAAAADLLGYGIPIAFDHMGYFEIEKGVQAPTFRSFLGLLADGDFWVKLSPVRVCKGDPAYAAARPFHDALVRAIPDRLLFSSDWPYISLDADPPDVGRMVNLFDAWTGDETVRRKVFVDNPRALYLGQPSRSMSTSNG